MIIGFLFRLPMTLDEAPNQYDVQGNLLEICKKWTTCMLTCVLISSCFELEPKTNSFAFLAIVNI